MLRFILRNIMMSVINYCFRRKNKHNSVSVGNRFPIGSVKVGAETYGVLNVIWMAPQWAKLKIGNYCSIGPQVTFLMGGQHDYKRISTWPFQSRVYKLPPPPPGQSANYDIMVEDDVWIGYGCLIMSGVTIGKGCVIGARSIVTKNIPPYSVFVGNKVLKKRFSDDIIEKLKELDFASIHHDKNDCYQEFCMTQINEDNVDKVVNAFMGK